MSIECNDRRVFFSSTRRQRGQHDAVFVLAYFADTHLPKLLRDDFAQFDLALTAGIAIGFLHSGSVDLYVLKKAFEESF